jgi:hypothetical protein
MLAVCVKTGSQSALQPKFDRPGRMLKGGIDLVGRFSAGLSQIGPAPATSADDRRDLLEPVTRVQAALYQIF